MGPGVSDLVMSHQQWFSEDVGSQPLSGKSYLTSKVGQSVGMVVPMSWQVVILTAEMHVVWNVT